MSNLRLVVGKRTVAPAVVTGAQAASPETPVVLDEYLPFLINRVASTMIVYSSGEFRRSGSDVPEFRILTALRQARSCRFGELAALTSIEPPSLHRHLARLSNKGLVRRSPDPRDQRSVQLAITVAGDHQIARLHPSARAMADQIMDGVSAADARRVKDVLKRMYRNLEKSGAEWKGRA